MIFCEYGLPCSFRGEQNICTKTWVHLNKTGIWLRDFKFIK